VDLALFFVLPLIGGFAFVTGFMLLRFRTGREDAQRLYYRAALYGVWLALAAGLAHVSARAWLMAYADFSSRISATLISALLERDKTTATVQISAAAARMRADVVLVCVYALALGAAAPIWSWIVAGADRMWLAMGRRSFLDRLNLAAITDQLERLMAESLYLASAVQITLSNSKVCVGVVLQSPDPALPAKHVTIQPLDERPPGQR
jgi:hypothetical protein